VSALLAENIVFNSPILVRPIEMIASTNLIYDSGKRIGGKEHGKSDA